MSNFWRDVLDAKPTGFFPCPPSVTRNIDSSLHNQSRDRDHYLGNRISRAKPSIATATEHRKQQHGPDARDLRTIATEKNIINSARRHFRRSAALIAIYREGSK